MSFSFRKSGSVRGLQHLRQHALQFKGAPKKVLNQMAAAGKTIFEEMVEECFAKRSDPYGKPWAPAKDGHLPQLERSGQLKDGFLVKLVDTGLQKSVAIYNAQFYSVYLQKGTQKMEPRKVVPDAGLPPKVRQRLQKEKDRIFREYAKP